MSLELNRALERARTAEQESASLQLRIDNNLQPEIDRLRKERDQEEQEKGKAKAEARTQSSARQDAESKADARARRIAELETEVEELQERIAALDPTEIEKRRQQAEQQRLAHEQQVREDEEERKQAEESVKSRETFWMQLKVASIVSILTIIGFVILYLAKVEMTWLVRGLGGGIVVVLAFFAPQILRLAQQVAPHAAAHSFGVSLGFAATISALVVSLGLPSGLAPWAQVLMWIGAFLGYTLLFQGAFLSVRQLLTEQRAGTDTTNVRSKVALGYITSFLLGLIGAGFYEYSDSASSSAPRYLVQVLIGMLLSGVMFLISMIANWAAQHIAAHSTGLFARESKKLSKIDKWLRACKSVAAIVSVFVGWIVGSGYAYANGHTSVSSRAMAIGIGFGVTVVFYLIEGKILEACFHRRYHGAVLAILVLFGSLFAAATAYLSFGKVYFVASEGPRFAEAQSALVKAENDYLAASEATCRMFAERQDDVVNNPYSESIKGMQMATEIAGRATDRSELVESARLFQESGSKASNCLNKAARAKNLLSSVVVFSEPTPSDLSSQYWFGTDIPGTSVHSGSARQAIVAVCVIDFLIVILSIFGWFFGAPRRDEENVKESAAHGRIVSIRSSDGVCFVATGLESGVQFDDVLNVRNDEGKMVGSLTVLDIDSFGEGLCLARPASEKMIVTVGMTVALAN